LSGAELAERVRALYPQIGVIFATGNTDMPEIGAGPKPVLLRKPYDNGSLLKAVVTARR
jgi:FixJ family two-component response regulator